MNQDTYKAFLDSANSVRATARASQPNPLGGSSRLYQLLEKLEKLLSEKYAFDVFAKDSINFGIIVTYRQTWEPQKYQVGDLVSTIPLAPKEVRRYTTRTVTKKARNVKEMEDNLQTRKTESSYTSRVDKEIVDKAENRTNWKINAHESYGNDQGFKIDSTQDVGGDEAKQSESRKKEFRESVLKSAQEYKHENRLEIETSESQETEETTFHEIQNPNDELTVTYLFYELQRQYKISEQIHSITPVILVANEVPAPNDINDAWLMEHDWILRRAILDDSFRPALDYLTKSFVGAEVNIRILENNAIAQKSVVEAIERQIRAQTQTLTSDEQAVLDAVRDVAASKQKQAIVDIVTRFFDPLGITGKKDTGDVSAAQAMADYANETLDRAEREKTRLLSQLEVAITALQAAVDKLSAAIKEHYDKVTEIDRLRVHVKDNILYYMQAIWSYEPPDQRFFRIYNIDVPIVTLNPPLNTTPTASVINPGANTGVVDILLGGDIGLIPIPMSDVKVEIKKLVEVADLDTVLGYKGNYMIFPLTEPNYLTLHMMQPYLEIAEQVLLRDPDDLANYTVDELQNLAACVYRNDKDLFNENIAEFRQLLIKKLTSPRKDYDFVVVPTKSLYIEALVGTHPLLEDFKLAHRALDVKKVQAEVRHAELENIRLASRVLDDKLEDPDIEKKIVIVRGQDFVVDTE